MSESYTPTFTNGHVANMVQEFVVDEKEDLDKIDISQLLAGSKTFVIKENKGQWYMLSNARKWEPVKWNSGGSSDVIYDGGEEKVSKEELTTETVYDGGVEG